MFWKRNSPTAFIKATHWKKFDSILGGQLFAFEGALLHKRQSQHVSVHWVNCCCPKSLRQACLLFCLQLACLPQMIHRVAEQHLVAFIHSFATFIWYLTHSMYLQCQILFIKLTKTGCDVLPAGTKCSGVKSWKEKALLLHRKWSNPTAAGFALSLICFQCRAGFRQNHHSTPSLWTSGTEKLILYLLFWIFLKHAVWLRIFIAFLVILKSMTTVS